uniref:Uncharacterized protein n=1 Tax=Oryza barthii TaxID=65489 RepID=A0A0D3FCQ1_9ORYZ
MTASFGIATFVKEKWLITVIGIGVGMGPDPLAASRSTGGILLLCSSLTGSNSLSSPPPPFSLSKIRLRLSKQWRSGEAQ